MIKNILFNKKKLIVTSIALALLLTLLSSYTLQLSVVILVLFLIYKFKVRAILVVIILSYIAFTSELYEQSRTYLQLISTLLLVILFLKEYGLVIKNYIKFPKEMLFYTILLLAMLFISTTFSFSPSTSLVTTIRMILFLFICYLFYALLVNEKNILTYIYSICIVSLTWGIRILIDLYNLGIQDYFKKILVRDVFSLQSSISYGSYTIFYISLSLLVALFFIKRFDSRNGKILLSIMIVFNILALILAHSRGIIMAAVLSISFLLITLKRAVFIKSLILISTVSLIVFLAFPNLQDTVNIYLREYSLNQRDAYWETGFDIISDYPLFGLGAGLFDTYFYSYASSTHLNFFKNPGVVAGKPHPHNFFLYFMAENGILGLITALGFFILFFRLAYKAIILTRNINNDYYILSVSIMGIGIGETSRSLFEITGHLTYGIITTDLPFWLVFIIVIYFNQKFSIKHFNKLKLND